MSEFEDDFDEYYPQAVNLTQADEGYVLCPDCGGTGVHIVPKMYPFGHVEAQEYCDTCNGDGQIEKAESASAIPASNKKQA